MSILTKQIYTELINTLAAGKTAAMLSEYSPDGTFTKRVAIYGEDDELDYLSSEKNASTDGPVTYLSQPDGSLLVAERYLPRPRIIILGGGHIALALSQLAKTCEFDTLVYDDRPKFANKERFPAADEVICDDFSRLFKNVAVKATDYVVIVTRGHKNDQECLEGVLKGEAPAYTGMIGSSRRVAIVLKQLSKAGYPKDRLDAVFTPIGLDIGAVTPAEISVSILSQIIKVKRIDRTGADGSSCDLETAARLAEKGEDADALITILETEGSVPRETGAKMSMTYEGSIIGTIGGGCAESSVMQEARTLIREGGWRTIDIDMTDTAEEDGMVCGGKMKVLMEYA